MNYILEYWNKISSGEILTSKEILQQFEILVEDLKNPTDDYIFVEELANAPIEFIEKYCKHSKAPFTGLPFKLELFQKAITQATFGFVHKETLLRKYDEVFLIMGRKNGKTAFGAALEHYMLNGDGEGGAEIYSVATKLDQAKIPFNEAQNMITQSKFLQKYTHKTKYEIESPSTFSFMKPLASDSKSMDGLNVHFALMDELHAWKVFDLYDVVKQATSARDQPLIFIISTNGFVRESVFDNKFQYGCDVLDGKIIDKRKLFFFYKLDHKDEWILPSMWIKANPGLGTIKKIEKLESFVSQAMNDDNFLPSVLTKDFNLPETPTGSWLTFAQLNNTEMYDLKSFKGHYAVAGTDLSAAIDLTCSTILLMKKSDPKIYCHQMYFIPEDILGQKVKDDKIPYDKWVKQGWIRLCKGNRIVQGDITKWHVELMKENGIFVYWHGYDEWNANFWVEEMKDTGFTMEIVRQGPKTFSGPMKTMKADLESNLIVYNNNPVLKWCLSNTRIERDKNDNIRPVKGRSPKQRIDGAVSLIDAYVVLQNHFNDYLNLLKK